MRVAVIGAGSWGTALARLAAVRADVRLWAREPEVVAAVRDTGENSLFLPGHPLPSGVRCTSDLAEALAGAELVVMAVPSHGFRAVLRAAAPGLPGSAPLLSVTKGIEQGTLKRMTEIVLEETGTDPGRVGVLTGPNLAREIADGQPAATVVAMRDEEQALAVQALFMGPTLRVYTNPDVIGCEAAGALKNVMAIAAGMGDLVATCISRHSRNRQVGVALGRGRPIEQIVADMHMVAEGVKTTEAVLALAERHGIEMPIASMVGAVLYDKRLPADMVAGLMGRPAKAELQGID